MAKNSIPDYSATAASNTDIQSVNIDEGCAPSGINNAIRELMVDLKNMDTGTVALTSPQMTSVDINGGTVDGTTIGASSAAAITGTTITGTSFVSTGNMTFGDNNKAIFGAGSDLQIYHSGSHSFIQDSGTGNLNILAQNLYLSKADNTEYMISAVNDGAVDLYYDGASKLSTTSGGIDVTGTITFDGGTTSADLNFGDNDKAIFGAGSDLQIYHNGSHSYLEDQGTGNLYIKATNLRLNNSANVSYLSADSGGAVSVYHNGSQKLATTATGIDVTGTVTADGLTVGYDRAGASGGFILYDDNQTENRLALTTGGGAGINAAISQAGGAFNITDASLNPIVSFAEAGDISFYDSTGVTQGLFWDASTQRLGLGTTSPDTLLTAALSTSTGTYFEGGGSGDSSESRRLLITASTTAFAGETHTLNAESGFGNLAFATGGTEHMRIDSSGNVGIGTNAPYDDGTNFSVLNLNGVKGGRLAFTRGTNSATEQWSIKTSDDDALRFNYGSAFSSEAMRIDSSGDVEITGGYASSQTFQSTGALRISSNSTTATANVALELMNDAGSARTLATFTNLNGVVGSISTNASATAYNTSSDYRLKENVVADWDATTRLKQLNPVRFNFIADADTTVDGFLAHEVQDIVPEAITGTHNEVDDDGNPVYQGIDQSKLVPLLVKTIQELEARIAALEAN